jgi:hypothetical protein
MLSRPARLLAFLLQPDGRRLAASLLAPLLLGLSFGCGYIAALSVGEADAIAPVDQPLVATVDCGPAALAAPQAAGGGIVLTRSVDLEYRPLCPTRERAPPALAS